MDQDPSSGGTWGRGQTRRTTQVEGWPPSRFSMTAAGWRAQSSYGVKKVSGRSNRVVTFPLREMIQKWNEKYSHTWRLLKRKIPLRRWGRGTRPGSSSRREWPGWWDSLASSQKDFRRATNDPYPSVIWLYRSSRTQRSLSSSTFRKAASRSWPHQGLMEAQIATPPWNRVSPLPYPVHWRSLILCWIRMGRSESADV